MDFIRSSYYTPAVANHLPTSVPTDLLAHLSRQAYDRCQLAAACSDELPAITRTFCSPAMARLHGLFRGWLDAAGMTCRLDAAGNLRGRLSCADNPDAPALLVGSHLDTVPNGGRYDGFLGAALGLALAEAVSQSELQLPFALEAIGFSEEEGVRFGSPFIGSLAVAGEFPEGLLKVVDANGVTVAQALADFGCPAEIPAAQQLPQDVIGFLEPHIEQGPILQAEDRPLAVVSAIAGQTRAAIRFVGAAGHAGTTPMHLRRDALAAAAEWITLVECVAQQTPGLVATVGVIEALPGAGNVIPGEARLRLDIRHADDRVRFAAIQQLKTRGAELADRRQVSFHFAPLHEHGAVAMNESLTRLLEECLPLASNTSQPRLVSGAGHDAAVMARRFPTAMLFIRCQDGISHHPDESVTLEDVTAALTTMWLFVERLAAAQRNSQ